MRYDSWYTVPRGLWESCLNLKWKPGARSRIFSRFACSPETEGGDAEFGRFSRDIKPVSHACIFRFRHSYEQAGPAQDL
jgi:hypothetical protein